MIRRIFVGVGLSLLVIAVLNGCERKADLVPSPIPGQPARPDTFCNLSDGKLTVIISNQGAADSLPSQTKVEFRSAVVTLPTGAIPAGGSVNVVFEIPAGCFQPDCFFKITVDSNSEVDESNEGNNSANGTCIG